jgi:dATP pyrophosphohydrolase
MPRVISDYLELYVFSRGTKKFLMLKRAGNATLHPGIWQTITATSEENETTKETLHRELEEETGLKNARVFIVPRVNCYYMEPLDAISLSPVFLAEVESVDIKISEEHDDFRWVSFDEAVKLIHWEDQVESLKVIEGYINDKEKFKKLVEINL